MGWSTTSVESGSSRGNAAYPPTTTPMSSPGSTIALVRAAQPETRARRETSRTSEAQRATGQHEARAPVAVLAQLDVPGPGQVGVEAEEELTLDGSAEVPTRRELEVQEGIFAVEPEAAG